MPKNPRDKEVIEMKTMSMFEEADIEVQEPSHRAVSVIGFGSLR
jgi:hypothetical protein